MLSDIAHSSRERLLSIGATDADSFWYGFYPVEYFHDGTAFRWTGPDRECVLGIEFPRQQPLIFELYCLRLMSPTASEGLFFEFDGRMVLAHHEVAFGLDRFLVPAPARLYGSRTKVTIHLNETVFERNRKDDRGRRLGMAFYQFNVLGSQGGTIENESDD